MSELSFAELGLDPAVLEAVSAVGYETPSPIQAQSIPALLAGNHLLGVAQTGTGKTAAFALPLLSRIDANVAEPFLRTEENAQGPDLKVGTAGKQLVARL